MTAIMTRRHRAPDAAGSLTYLALGATALLFLAPFWYMLVAASRPMAEMNQWPPPLLPGEDLWSNVATAIEQQSIGLALWNSLVVSGLITAGTVGFCTLAGFAFAKLRFRGRDALFTIMFSSLAVPFAVIVVPLFIMVAKARLTEPYFSLVVPWVAPAFGIFMMRQFTEQAVPDELLDAARMDGCTEFGLFRRVVLPLLRPALGALGVWSFLNSYNSLLWPLIVISEPEDYTLPMGIQALFGATGRQYDLVLAGSVLAAVPSLLVFFLLRRQLLEGLTAGAVKA
jgi:multiple sugar transport system permease protein